MQISQKNIHRTANIQQNVKKKQKNIYRHVILYENVIY